MKIRRVLVTGSSGTIGTRLCEKLLDAGFDVTGVDWKKNKWSRRVDDLTVKCNLLDRRALERLKGSFDLVIHLAANARVYNLVVDPEKAMENFQTLFNSLEFARKRKVKRFIFSSSREVYGNSGKTTHKEEDADVGNCESPYTASKIGGEALVHAYAQCYGIGAVIVRFSNVYGMYDESDRVIPLYIRLTSQGKDLTVYGKEKFLDFTYIDDAVSGVMRCVERFDGASGGVFNIASGKGYSIGDIASMVRERMGGKNSVVMEENRTGEVVKFVADIGKARKILGYDPKIGIDEGVTKSIEWFRSSSATGK